MNGYCMPKGIGFYKSRKIKVVVRLNQKWQYKYGMRNGDNIVEVSRDNVTLYLPKDNFEKEWEIVR